MSGPLRGADILINIDNSTRCTCSARVSVALVYLGEDIMADLNEADAACRFREDSRNAVNAVACRPKTAATSRPGRTSDGDHFQQASNT